MNWRKIAVIITIFVIVVVAVEVLIFANENSTIKIKNVKITFPKGKSYYHYIGLFSMNDKPYIFLASTIYSSSEGANYSESAFYITNVPNLYEVKSKDWNEITTINCEVERVSEFVYGNFVYFSLSLSNDSSFILKLNENMHLENVWYIKNLEVNSIYISHGNFYLFGKNKNVIELLKTENFEDFKKLYATNNIWGILESYFLNYSSVIYLTYGSITTNMSYKSSILAINGNNCSEILNSTATGLVFAFLQDNKIYYYRANPANVSLFIINPMNNRVERNYTIPYIPFYHAQRGNITIAIGKHILYSRDGINFNSLCSRNANFDITSQNQILVSNGYLYVLLSGYQIEILKCKIPTKMKSAQNFNIAAIFTILHSPVV